MPIVEVVLTGRVNPGDARDGVADQQDQKERTRKRATLKEQPDEGKPRERLMRLGPGALSDAELLAILMRVGRQQVTVLELAQDLLTEVRGLSSLANMNYRELCQIKGIGPAKACQILAGVELGRRVLSERAQPKPGEKFNSPERVYEVFAPKLMLAEAEHVLVIYLNTKLVKIGEQEISRGGLSQAVAEPREIFKEAVRRSAASIILVHNHPSGDPTPSEEDRRLTTTVREVGKMVGIPLTDHIIIGHGSYYSFERGKVTAGSLK
ncbi:MAG: RadC family protein [bacterium JZ-2024 1]